MRSDAGAVYSVQVRVRGQGGRPNRFRVSSIAVQLSRFVLRIVVKSLIACRQIALWFSTMSGRLGLGQAHTASIMRFFAPALLFRPMLLLFCI